MNRKWNLVLNPYLHEDGTVVEGTSDTGSAGGSPTAEAPEVIYGKPGGGQAAPTGTPGSESSTAQPDIAVRLEAYKASRDAYKDLYEADFKTQLGQRLKGHQKDLAAYKGIAEPLMAYFNLSDISEFQKFIEGEILPQVKDGEQYQSLMAKVKEMGDGSGALPPEEAAFTPADLVTQGLSLKDTLKAYGVEFDLPKAMNDPKFAGLLDKGIPVDQAYFALNHKDMLLKAGQTAAEAQKAAVLESIRTKGINAVTESAARSTPPVIVKDNPADWTPKDMDNVIKQVMAGKQIAL
jgi:hypothetical protein